MPEFFYLFAWLCFRAVNNEEATQYIVTTLDELMKESRSLFYDTARNIRCKLTEGCGTTRIPFHTLFHDGVSSSQTFCVPASSHLCRGFLSPLHAVKCICVLARLHVTSAVTPYAYTWHTPRPEPRFAGTWPSSSNLL
jgi:hypothetical protein